LASRFVGQACDDTTSDIISFFGKNLNAAWATTSDHAKRVFRRITTASNQFTGGLPAGMGSIPTLEEVYIHVNSFTGSADAELCTCCTLCCSGEGEALSCAEPPLPPTPAPVGPNITDAEADMRFAELVGLLTPISGVDVFQDMSSPQYAAANWMAEEDPLVLNFSAISLDVIVQRYLLTLVYYSTNGSNWDDQEDFLSQVDVCDWSGVDCNDGAFIIGLDLARNNLDGMIPTELRFLLSLEELQMQRNVLKGNMPSEIGDFPNLQELDLSENMLTGNVPSEIGQLLHPSQN
jgi:hypothetical protein